MTEREEFETTPITTPVTTSAATSTATSTARDDVRPESATDPGVPGVPGSVFRGSRPVRMRTVVVGIVLLAIAVLSNLNVTTSLDFQLGPVVLALMIGCGVLLIVGASRRE